MDKCQQNQRNEIAFQSKADHPRTTHANTIFCSCDLDLDPMTLIYELDLDLLKIYLHTKCEVSRSVMLSKVRARTVTVGRNTETDRQTNGCD